MAEVLLITDQHFGVRNDSLVFATFYKKFYSEVVIPFIKASNIKHVIALGDTFDRRKSINFNSLDLAKEMWFDPLHELGVELTMLVGNHDIYYKNTIRVNAPQLLLGEYDNIRIIDEPQEVNVAGLDIYMTPWICDANREKSVSMAEETECTVCMGHFEFNGFEAHPGHVMDHGSDHKDFAKFAKVFSGHYHSRSAKDNVQYLGNPYQLYWNDYDSRRGFTVLNTENLTTMFYRNPFKMFNKIYYKDDLEIKDFSKYEGKYVKLIVEDREDHVKFDKTVKALYDVGVADLKIVEDLSVELEDSVELETEDTLTLLEQYVDETDFSDKLNIKKILKSLYTEACSL
jgi:DNA repair exonuclease SbcCD nuclease subunit